MMTDLTSFRKQRAEQENILPTSTTVSGDDLVLYSHPALNPAYTLVFGVVATSPPLQSKEVVKYIYSQRPAVPGAIYQIPWFESEETNVGPPGATIVSLAEWPEMWQHPERLKTARNLASLVAHFDAQDHTSWQAFVDSFNLFLT